MLSVFSREYLLASNSLDIGIKPAAGLRPKMLRPEHAVEDAEGKILCLVYEFYNYRLYFIFFGHTQIINYISGSEVPNAHFKLLSQRELAKIERMSSKRVSLSLLSVLSSYNRYDTS